MIIIRKAFQMKNKDLSLISKQHIIGVIKTINESTGDMHESIKLDCSLEEYARELGAISFEEMNNEIGKLFEKGEEKCQEQE